MTANGGHARGALRGLFAGGTLCDEAMVIATDALGPVRSNIPLEPEWALPDTLQAHGHVMIDFGDDRLTQGRPHPMIDPSLRLERLAAEAADPECSVVLMDVVLGYGADPDPAARLAPAIRGARATAAENGRELAVIVSLCGTRADPQGFDRQAGTLHDAGASVYLSNAAAAHRAVALVNGESA
jgi:FdrA protein